MTDTGSTTTIGIVGIALLVAMGGLVGASMGMMGANQTEGSSLAYENVEHGISWIAFCGDADSVTIEETWEKENDDPAAVQYSANGGNVTDIIYFGGGDFFHITPADNDGGFVFGDGESLEYSVPDFPQDDPCSIDEVNGTTIDKFENYNSADDEWDVDD